MIQLNEKQRESISHKGNICIEACPGSGKTRTIVAKLLWCIEKVRNTSRRIACITYTHAAVNEIEMRLREYGTTGDDDYCEIGTIHSFCLTNVLQPFHYFLDELNSGFEVIAPDSDQWRTLIRNIGERYGVNRRDYDYFSNVHRSPDHSLFIPSEIPEEAAIELVNHLDENSLVSFPDIVYHSSRLIEGYHFIARGLGCRFAWILIDEFQDTSSGQIAIIKAIASYGKTQFFLVGDPNQSIMAFAGAHPGLMPIFANEINARMNIRLEGNYRSSEKIISHAESLICTNPRMCAIGRFKDFPVEPMLYNVNNPTTGIFEYYLPAVDELGIGLGEAAVLAPWWRPLYLLGRDLRERGIPVIGPGARPYRRTRLFASFAEHLCAYIEEHSPELFRSTQRSLFLMLLNITGAPEWKIFSYIGQRCLCGIIKIAKDTRERYNTAALQWLRTVSVNVEKILSEFEFLPEKYFKTLTESVKDMILDMERNDIDLDNLSVSDMGLFAKPRNCLQLVTMHSSKGREFDSVAIIDLHDGRVPHFNWSSHEEYDESRRQLYVAITRARKLLMYFTDNSDRRNRPSPFLDEMGLE